MAARMIRPSTTRGSGALWIKALFNAVAFFAVFLALLPWLFHRVVGVALPLDFAVNRVLGVMVFVSAVLVWFWCLRVFVRQGRGTPFPLDAPRHLVTTGPYAIMRNPIMTTEVAIAWAEALYFGSLGVLLYAVLVSVLAHVVVVKVEEPELRARMGDAYSEYCARVPRWLPRLPRRAVPPSVRTVKR